MRSSHTGIIHARIMGALFLLVFVFYGAGRHFFDVANPAIKYIGATLIVINSILVFCIGILFRKILRKHNAWVGSIYFAGRLVEALALANIVINLFQTPNWNDDTAYFVGMLVLGISSVPMCWVLYKYRLSPRWLSIWGLVGYSIFSVGFSMEFFGKQWSIYLLGVAGLWEVVFGCWLIIYNGRYKKSHPVASSQNGLLIRGHSPRWINDFTDLKAAIDSGLHGLDYSIEHVGSTAVPGLAAKPIIDMDIIYSDIKVFEKIKLALEKMGYYHAGNQGIEDRDVFKRSGQGTAVLDTVKHHLYVCAADSKALERHILSRNFLRKNDWAKQKYQQMKYDLAKRAGEDRKIYAELKEQSVNDFIDSMIEEERRTAN